jgi:orotate phosphoribosyltransferase
LAEGGEVAERRLAFIDRESGGAANLSSVGLELRSLLTMSELQNTAASP